MAADQHPEAGTARAAGWWSPLVTVRLMHGLLWLVVAAAPVVAVVALAEVSTLRRQVAEAAAPVEVPADTSRVEGLAEMAITDFFTTGSDTERVPESQPRWAVERTTSLGAEQVTPGYFEVTVAADVSPLLDSDATDPPDEATEQAGTPTGQRMVFAIGLAETDTGWMTTGPPSLIANPQVTPLAESTGRGGDRLDLDSGLAGTVLRFLAALLAGDGELARYTAPRLVLTAVTPAPFDSVELTQATSTPLPDGARRVVANVAGVDPSGASMPLTYTMDVAEREGRWEVTDLLLVPPLPDPIPINDVSSEGGSS